MLTQDDVLHPEIVRVDGRRYRKLPVRSTVNVEQPRDMYREEDYYYYDEAESCVNEYSTIQQTEHGFCDYIRDIPSFYFKFILGKKASMKYQIESQTKTTLKFPNKGENRGDVVITGRDRNGVLAARSRITAIIDMHRGEQYPEHFLSIPLNSENLVERFKEFKTEVLKLEAKGLEAGLFQFPERLHLTLGLLTFLNKQELVDNQTKFNGMITALKLQHLGDKKIVLNLKGIEYMNDDPGEVDILYAKVKLHGTNDSSNLQKFVDDVVSTMTHEGFIKKQYDRVKLHATVINSLFRERKRDTDKSSGNYYAKSRTHFDAREILKNFADFDFGTFTVESIDISVRGKFERDGRYRRDGYITL